MQPSTMSTMDDGGPPAEPPPGLAGLLGAKLGLLGAEAFQLGSLVLADSLILGSRTLSHQAIVGGRGGLVITRGR